MSAGAIRSKKKSARALETRADTVLLVSDLSFKPKLIGIVSIEGGSEDPLQHQPNPK